MRPKDEAVAKQLDKALKKFSRDIRSLPGITDQAMRETLLEQFIESLHRVAYIKTMLGRPIGQFRSDPRDPRFDPFLAAISALRAGDLDEACWLVFLGVHFGKNSRGGWRYAREVYAAAGRRSPWDWKRVSANPEAFKTWLDKNASHIRRKSPPGGFGNHRKYMTLDAYYPAGTGAAVSTYVGWIRDGGGHEAILKSALKAAKGDPRAAFALLYKSMERVAGFGRMARFDYLTMLGKMGIAGIEPGSAYLETAIGPMTGAKLLFCGRTNAKVSRSDLDGWINELEPALGVGMQVMEDALCNWQKSPLVFKPFRG